MPFIFVLISDLLFLSFALKLIPRKVWLDRKGKRLIQWPIEEVETLRGKKVELRNKKKLVKGEKVEIKGITAAQV